MNTLLLSVLLTTPTSPLGQGIYGGFTLRWVGQQSQVAQVAISTGSAIIDGNQVIASAGGFPNDSLPVTPIFPVIVPVLDQSYAAYCYVVDLGAPGVVLNTWFAPVGNADAFDFHCYVGSAYSPTPDGHPSTALPYGPFSLADGGIVNLSVLDAIFVGSVIGPELAVGELYYGNNPGFSVMPFFRNGSQAIYATDKNFISAIDTNWDLGIPTQNGGVKSPISGPFNILTCPQITKIDFTLDGLTNVLPLSASQVIYDFDGYAHDGATDTACFMDPNVPVWVGLTGLNRSCQVEIQMDPEWGNWVPLHPVRASVNIGNSTVAGNGYGETWIGTACSQPNNGTSYIEVAYRGYVEPERQLVPQILP